MAMKLGDKANASILYNLSSAFKKNIFKTDDKYTILLNNSQNRTFSGEFRNRRTPNLGWTDIFPPKGEDPNVSQCDENGDYCLNSWGGTYTEGAAW